MSYSWEEYYKFANWLQGFSSVNFSQETKERNVISRSYYASYRYAYNFAKNNLSYMPVSPPGRNHKELPKFLNRNGKRHVASRLKRLHTWRKKADYHDVVSNTNTLANNSLIQAKYIIDNL